MDVSSWPASSVSAAPPAAIGPPAARVAGDLARPPGPIDPLLVGPPLVDPPLVDPPFVDPPTGERTTGAVPPRPTGQQLELVMGALRGMAYEHRFRILVLLLAAESTPAELAAALPLETTVVAHHLRHLRDAKLIRRQRRGRRVFYTLSSAATRRLVGEVIRFAGDEP